MGDESGEYLFSIFHYMFCVVSEKLKRFLTEVDAAQNNE